MKSLFNGQGVVVDRRSFLATVGLTTVGMAVGTAATAGVLPASALFAAPGHVMARYMLTDSAPDGVWDADSVFGHFPRYDHPVGFSRAPRENRDLAQLADVDRNFII